MAEQQVAFDDWQAEADKIDHLPPKNQVNKQKGSEFLSERPSDRIKQSQKLEEQLNWIQKMKIASPQNFESIYKNKNVTNRKLVEFPFMLKTQKDFIELAKITSLKFKVVGQGQPQKVLPQNQIFTFFQEMIQYLYPNIQWQNLQYTKQKLNIVKKDRKLDEVKAKKLKEKQQRLKRNQKQNLGKKQHIQEDSQHQKKQKEQVINKNYQHQ